MYVLFPAALQRFFKINVLYFIHLSQNIPDNFFSNSSIQLDSHGILLFQSSGSRNEGAPKYLNSHSFQSLPEQFYLFAFSLSSSIQSFLSRSPNHKYCHYTTNKKITQLKEQLCKKQFSYLLQLLLTFTLSLVPSDTIL